MKVALSSAQVQKQKIRQSVFTLLVFFENFFSQNELFYQVDFEQASLITWHDCNLCQQGVDTPPAAIELKPTVESVSFVNDSYFSSVIFLAINYLFPPLRAPPIHP
jgi:hypothetical protein